MDGALVRALALMLLATLLPAAAPTVKITLKHGTEREARTKAQLERVLADYDLSKYTFTREVVIEGQAINHAFPVLTLNVRFADSEDELLSSFVHEQLHWHLRDRGPAMQNAIAELRRVYPHVPVGGQEGAETEIQHVRTPRGLLPRARGRSETDRAGAHRRRRGRQRTLHVDLRHGHSRRRANVGARGSLSPRHQVTGSTSLTAGLFEIAHSNCRIARHV